MSGPQGGALEYDLSGNLTGLERRDEGSALVDALSFDYEAGPGSGASSRLTEVQDAAGALHAWDAASGSFAYDANGALVEAPAPYGLTGAAYDERGLPVRLDLAGGAAARYRYSLEGQRTYEQVTGADGAPGEAEHILLDAEGGTLGVARGGQIAYWNVALPSGEIVGRHEADGARRYYLKDRLGSVRAVLDESGVAVETRDHYPFGLRMPGRGLTTGTPAKEGFTGHELDGETGLVYAGARYLMPALGRWTSTDPILGEQTPEQLLKGGKGALLSTSPYNYVLNNPIGLVDEDGRAPSSCPSCDIRIDNRVERYLSGEITREEYVEETVVPLGAVYDFVRNYREMRNANTIGADKYYHCKANCEAAQRGRADKGIAFLISKVRELVDRYVKGDPEEASKADQEANQHGRENADTGECTVACEQFRPDALDQQGTDENPPEQQDEEEQQ